MLLREFKRESQHVLLFSKRKAFGGNIAKIKFKKLRLGLKFYVPPSIP
jgi:hypothetical protein